MQKPAPLIKTVKPSYWQTIFFQTIRRALAPVVC
jgi:hypothetical protein